MTREGETGFSLLDAARVLARGRDLDAKLQALAEQARSLGRATAGSILLYDSDTGLLANGDGSSLPPIEDDAVAGALRDRRPVWLASSSAWLAARLGGAARATMVPLVMEDEHGRETEGLLLVSTTDPGPDDATQDALLALSDMAAVAIRQDRLQHALVERAEYLERLARTDPLTGLADRRTFEQMLELELARAARQGTALALAVFDVDGLTAINERHGSGTGDDVLRHVAATLADEVRLVDTVARLGEDEFGVLAPGDAGGVVARRIRDAVAGAEPLGPVHISISAGVAHHPQDGTTGEQLLAAAIRAIELAREQGPGAVVGARDPAR